VALIDHPKGGDFSTPANIALEIATAGSFIAAPLFVAVRRGASLRTAFSRLGVRRFRSSALKWMAGAVGFYGRPPLDEAANICRFKNLDSYYSHFGSRGIIIHTILQNWAQGEEVWGKIGMEKLWSAANIKVYGGGVDDDRFLGRLSALLGEYDYVARSSSKSTGSRTISRSVQRRSILTVADLRDLPPGRAVLLASGTPPVLVEPQPWYTGPHEAEIQASIDAHSGPANPFLKQVAMNAPLSSSKTDREGSDDE